MNLLRISLPWIAVVTFAWLPGPRLSAAEPAGEWKAPASDGRAYRDPGTTLLFPQRLGEYRLAGKFEYKGGGGFLRYECLDRGARADIFIFACDAPVQTLEQKQVVILKELDKVVADMLAMEKEGRYTGLRIEDVGTGTIEQWKQDPLPVASRIIVATRKAGSPVAPLEVVLNQWTAVTVVANHLVTIRHMRPEETGDEGEKDVKNFAGMVFQIIKDPPLRQELSKFVSVYLQDPFSEQGREAANAVIAYMRETSFHPVAVPEDPFTLWLARCKQVVPGSERDLLAALMIGAGKASFEGADPAECFKQGCLQFAKMYKELLSRNPRLADPEMEDFAVHSLRGEGPKWLEKRRATGGTR